MLTDSLGKDCTLDGFRRNTRGASFDDSPVLCPKCERIIKGDVCIHCGNHIPAIPLNIHLTIKRIRK